MNDEQTWPPQRRQADHRIEAIETRIGKVEDLLVENTRTTNEVKDILTTFKTLGSLAKWAGYIVAAVASAIAALKGLRG